MDVSFASKYVIRQISQNRDLRKLLSQYEKASSLYTFFTKSALIIDTG